MARDPAGGRRPGRYLPDRTPSAIGDHTIWPMPSSEEAGTTRSSMTRHSAEYWGWLDTSLKPIRVASSWPARIWSAVHSETPM